MPDAKHIDESAFFGYIGDPDFHDGSVVEVQQEGTTARVLVRGASGRAYAVDFQGVSEVKANHPEEMLLYALVEMDAPPPYRCFVFANWNDADESFLEVLARDCYITVMPPSSNRGKSNE